MVGRLQACLRNAQAWSGSIIFKKWSLDWVATDVVVYALPHTPPTQNQLCQSLE